MIIYQLIITALLLFLFGFTWKNLKDFKQPSLRASEEKIKKPLISICIPARDEEKNIRTLVRSLMNQTYSRIEILVLDDHSTDHTAIMVEELALEDARVRCIPGKELYPGWSGKTFALQQLGQLARGEWLLFCDADTKLTPVCVETVLSEATSDNLDALSLFPLQITQTWGEKLLIPLIYFVLTSYLPFNKVRHTANPTLSAGCGQFFFVKKNVFMEVGGFKEIKATLHDGSKFPQLLKKKGKQYNLFDGQKLVSCRMYTNFKSTWQGLSRSFYSAVNFPLFALNLLWHGALFVAPLFFLIVGLTSHKPFLTWIFLPFIQLATAIFLRQTQNRHFHLPTKPTWLTPVSFTLFCTLQIHSFLRHQFLHSVTWKGRKI